MIPCKSAPVIWTSYTDYRIGIEYKFIKIKIINI